MVVKTKNLIQGPASIYYGAFGAVEPADITVAVDSVPGFADMGGTKDGVTLSVADEFSALTVDQIMMEVGRVRTGRVVTVGTNLAEATLENIARALNNSAPVDNVLELDNGLEAVDPEAACIIIEGIAPGGKRRRITLRRTHQTENVEMAYKKDEQTVVPVVFTALWVSATMAALRIEDEPDVAA